MTLYAEGASTTTKLTRVEVYYRCVPIRTGNSITPRGFVVDPLKSTNGVAISLILSLEISNWLHVLAKGMFDMLPVSINTLLTEKFAMVTVNQGVVMGRCMPWRS